MAAAATVSWQQLLEEAEAHVANKRFFDGVQSINSCMEDFEKSVLGGDGETTQIIKDPAKYCEIHVPKMSAETKACLGRMHNARGDAMLGLGAAGRAQVEYSCAALCGHPGAGAKASEAVRRDADFKVPVTVLTGFLGAGKTTLLNHILRENHGRRIAVIENEFAEIGIDDGLVENMTEIVEMMNGCICCTVRGDLISGLKKLIKRSEHEAKPLDAVIIETTGMADPAPVAQTFFADQYVREKYTLDGILTLVDAKHIVQHLEEVKPKGVTNEAKQQVAFADRVLLNKCDLATEDELLDVERRLRAINKTVQVRRTNYSHVDMSFVLGIRAFSLDRVLELDGGFLAGDFDHEHDEHVSSVGVDIAGEVDWDKLNTWIGWLLQKRAQNLFRYKGLLAVQGKPEKFVLQGIHMIFTGLPMKNWEEGEERRCKMCFIGKDLDREELTSGFMACVV